MKLKIFLAALIAIMLIDMACSRGRKVTKPPEPPAPEQTGIVFPKVFTNETHDFITYDTQLTSLGYYARISRPRNYFTGNTAMDTASRAGIIFHTGLGEVGGFWGLASYGPHAAMNAGWDGGVELGNGVHYPIIISVTSQAPFPGTKNPGDVLEFLVKTYKLRIGAVHLTGLSMGAMTWGRVLSAERTRGGREYMKLVRSFTSLQGAGSSWSDSANGAPFQLGGAYVVKANGPWGAFGIWSKHYKGQMLNISGAGDNGSGPNGWLMAKGAADSLPGSGATHYSLNGGGSHCCWDYYYNNSMTDWTTSNPNISCSGWDGNYCKDGSYIKGENMYQWMLRTGDTTIAGLAKADTLFLHGLTGIGTSAQPLDTAALKGKKVIALDNNEGTYEEGLWIKGWKGKPHDYISIVKNPRLKDPVNFIGLHAQISIQSCEYILLGKPEYSPDTSKFDIRISHATKEYPFGPGYHGISITGNSKNITMGNIEMYRVNQGIEMKDDPSCDSSLLYVYERPWNFTMDSIFIYRVWVKVAQAEGFYIGNTGADNNPWYKKTSVLDSTYQNRTIFCVGWNPGHDVPHSDLDTVFPEPKKIGLVRVSYCWTDSTGRGGIQIVDGDTKNIQEVQYNRVFHAGMIGHYDQGCGIVFGAYTKPFVHHNHVFNTLSEGVAFLGAGQTGYYCRIENNLIEYSGFLNYFKSPYYEGTPPLPNWDFSSMNPGQPWNNIPTSTTPRTSIIVTSELILHDRQKDSIQVTIKNNKTGPNRSHMETYLNGVPVPGVYYSMQIRSYYQLETKGTAWVICNNYDERGKMWPYKDEGDTLRGYIQLSNMGTAGDPLLGRPQVNPLLEVNKCNSIPPEPPTPGPGTDSLLRVKKYKKPKAI